MTKYTINQFSKLSGFNKILIRTWENRYDLFSPERTKTNVRLYSDDCLVRALNIGILQERGLKISKIAQLNDVEIKAIVDKTPEDKSSNFIEYKNKILEAGLTFNEGLFSVTIDKAIDAFGLIQVYTDILLPTLERIGVLWLTNKMAPSQEHFVSELIKQKIISCSSSVKGQTTADTWLLFLPEGEHHEIGLLVAKYMLAEKGQSLIYLGQSLTVSHLEIIVDYHKVDNVLFSIVTRESARRLDFIIDKLSSYFPTAKFYCITPKSNIKDRRNDNLVYLTSIEEFKAICS